jgi:hypothetical protein
MKCSRCNAVNKSSLTFCEKCEARLPDMTVIKKRNPLQKKTVAIIFIVLLAGIAGFAYMARDFLFPPSQLTESTSAVEEEYVETGKGEELGEISTGLGDEKKEQSVVTHAEKGVASIPAETSPKRVKRGTRVIAGWVSITDPWGREVTRFRAGMLGNGWLALPARACLGGSSWRFIPDYGPIAEISGGLWKRGDGVGLWHLSEVTNGLEEEGLGSWNEGEPVSWKSLESVKTRDALTLFSGVEEGFFMSVSIPDDINEIGLFVQNGKVVGWSFGQWQTQGYMWKGGTAEELKYDTLVSSFYPWSAAFTTSPLHTAGKKNLPWLWPCRTIMPVSTSLPLSLKDFACTRNSHPRTPLIMYCLRRLLNRSVPLSPMPSTAGRGAKSSIR